MYNHASKVPIFAVAIINLYGISHSKHPSELNILQNKMVLLQIIQLKYMSAGNGTSI